MNLELIEIHWTSGSLEEARRIAHFLVHEHLVACAQIIPAIESVYLWKERVENSQECKIILKTRLENYEPIRVYIEQNCKYEVPEIIWFKIEGGNQSYVDWLRESSTRPISG